MSHTKIPETDISIWIILKIVYLFERKPRKDKTKEL
jgi:hypothetical protein